MERRPNILLVIADQLRVDALGFMGRTPCRTPNIDRLAREGISFDRAICTTPLCLPSRASLFTGQYPHQIDMTRNTDAIRVEPYLTDRLRAAGYHTAYTGKWHLEPQELASADARRYDEATSRIIHTWDLPPRGQRQIDRWFDRAAAIDRPEYSDWCAKNGLPDGWYTADVDGPELVTHRVPPVAIPAARREKRITADQTFDAWIADNAMRLLDERPADQPFFLVCSINAPIPSFKVPDPYFDMYDPADAPEPPNFRPTRGEPDSVERSFFHQLWKDHGETWEAWRKSLAVYWGFTTMMDSHLGRLVARLERDSLLDDTLVVFCSDHGEMFGSHRLWQKMAPYEECLRVPLVMRFPERIRPGLRSTAAASLINVPATILSVAGCEVPEAYAGQDLSPAFGDGRNPDAEPYAFAEMRSMGDFHGICDYRVVVDDRYKFVWHDGDRAELYDLSEDPFELENLADATSMATIRTRLSARLGRWMQETADPLLSHFEG